MSSLLQSPSWSPPATSRVHTHWLGSLQVPPEGQDQYLTQSSHVAPSQPFLHRHSSGWRGKKPYMWGSKCVSILKMCVVAP